MKRTIFISGAIAFSLGSLDVWAAAQERAPDGPSALGHSHPETVTLAGQLDAELEAAQQDVERITRNLEEIKSSLYRWESHMGCHEAAITDEDLQKSHEITIFRLIEARADLERAKATERELLSRRTWLQAK